MQIGPTNVTSEGVDPWTPPPGFENPVPEPGGPLRKGGCGCTVIILILLAAIGVGAVLLWPTIRDTKDSVEQFVEDAQEAVDVLKDTPGTTETGTEADGKSNLPGGGATLTYRVLRDETEWSTANDSIDGVDGNLWGVLRSSGTSSMVLQSTPAADDLGASLGDTGTRDGHRRIASRTSGPDGAKVFSVYYPDPSGSFHFTCTAAPGDDDFWRSCIDAEKTLKFSG